MCESCVISLCDFNWILCMSFAISGGYPVYAIIGGVSLAPVSFCRY